MAENIERVDVPSWAKLNRKGQYYAMKRDLPCFADRKDVRGFVVIGTPSGEPGKMIPVGKYETYCMAPGEGENSALARRVREHEEMTDVRRAERAAELEQEIEGMFVSLEKVGDSVSCYPLGGFLAEKFFRESGMGDILEAVFGEERACLVKLSAALLALENPSMTYECLDEYPMERHMYWAMDRFFTARLWAGITRGEERRVHKAWIEHVQPRSVSALNVESRMTLYHDRYSDEMGGWFSSRIRRGTKYERRTMIYRDMESGRLLAEEAEKTYLILKMGDECRQVESVRHSDYPQLRDASIHYFFPSYTYGMDKVMKRAPVSVCLQLSEYPDRKVINQKLKELEKHEEVPGYRILRWKGELEGVEGMWTLVENVSLRSGIEKKARDILRRYKARLQAMSYYTALLDFTSCYFSIESESDEFEFRDNAPFTVKAKPGGTQNLRNNYGRYVCFSTEAPLTDKQLIHRLWCEEDILDRYNAFMNQGETTDITEEYFDAMSGRELPLFLASMFREWIYEHVCGQSCNEDEFMRFLSVTEKWECILHSDGTPEMTDGNQDVESVLKQFGVGVQDVTDYLARVIRQKDYFDEDYALL